MGIDVDKYIRYAEAMPRAPIRDAEERLLASGLALFARRGCERVNTNAIARRAGLGVGTFYVHFSDKYALLRQLQLRTLDGLQAARLAALEQAERDPADQVRHAARAAIEFATAHPDAYRVTFGRERAASAAHGPILTESGRPIAQALTRLQAEARLDPALDATLAARAYLSMEAGMLLWWLEDPARATPDALVETLARLHPAVQGAGPGASMGRPAAFAPDRSP